MQLSYYACSVGTLFAFLWGLRVVKSVHRLSFDGTLKLTLNRKALPLPFFFLTSTLSTTSSYPSFITYFISITGTLSPMTVDELSTLKLSKI